jgi:hypothetical protein
MARAKDLAQIMTDLRLTPEARCIVAHIYLKGDGEHEITADELASVVLHPSRGKVQSAVRIGCSLGYIERREGGRGHSPFYRYRGTPDGQLKALSSPPDEQLNTENGTSEARDEIIGDRQTSTYPLSSPSDGHLSSRARESRAVGVVGVGVDNPSIISPSAERALEKSGDKLNGCRGALRDYLAARVPPARQVGYVQLLVGWRDGIDGTVFRRPDGSAVPPEDQTALLANALNDLAASDEAKMSRPLGDPANLRTKINILLRDPRPVTPRTPGPGRATGARPAPQTYDYSNASTTVPEFK